VWNCLRESNILITQSMNYIAIKFLNHLSSIILLMFELREIKNSVWPFFVNQESQSADTHKDYTRVEMFART
jgi:hypothetical protein